MTSFTTVWRKSRRSDAFANCVELGRTSRGLGIRDSKNPGQTVDISAPTAVRFLAFISSGSVQRARG
ncbi:DUF397 domain-containing protein [Actinokineospora cianjurensis]|uniref:Uncharacterized protein DUF397 n=1 Tax=Actinokineospora cianjurensis TaxID=585224 RepID=A0A421BBY7_9PSEU|nr:DUF397 domain-containing protein [Actinokineospora cianjurensis]RLK61851.1 uncharacterized protein DUF397 [Actinokineospora cianjurensis]